MLDNHLSALVQNRKSAILSCRFEVVNKKGKVDDKLTKLLQSKWFYDFCSLSLDSLWYGFSLIQFGDIKDSAFASVELVPRYYVKPEFEIVVKQPSSITGESWLDAPFNKWAIGVGDKTNLGLLAKAGPLVLWKKFALEAWAEYVQTCGVPTRIIRTDLRDPTSRSNAENMLRNMGVAGYGVFDTKDLFEMAEAKNTAAAELFDMLIARCNSELSKLFVGAAGNIDEKAFVGAAKIHAATLDKLNDQDKIFLENVFTYQLVPLLNMHGFGFDGMKIQIKPDEKVDLQAKFLIDSKLLDYYDIPVEYITETYGTPVLAKAKAEPEQNTNSIEDVTDKLQRLYDAN